MFQAQLESINKDELNSPTLNANYFIRYKGSLIKRHFKSLAQVMPYLIYDLVLDAVLESWLVVGQLVVLLWHTSIKDIKCYLISTPLFSNIPLFNLSRMLTYQMLSTTSSPSVPKLSSIFSFTFPCLLGNSILPFFFQLNIMNCSTMFTISHQFTATAKHPAMTHVNFLQHKTM